MSGIDNLQAAAAGLADLCFQRDRAEQCDIACTIQEGRPFVCQLQQIVCSPGPRQYQVSVKGLMPFLREADIDASDVLTLAATASCDILVSHSARGTPLQRPLLEQKD